MNTCSKNFLKPCKIRNIINAVNNHRVFKFEVLYPLKKNILITGAAGFIGANLTLKLIALSKFGNIIGVDNLNDYYDVSLKEYRLKLIDEAARNNFAVTWNFQLGDIADKNFVDKIFAEIQPEVVVNLAAQAGVRHSITNPAVYIESNIVGFFNVLEACCHLENFRHLVYASSSSVYGGNKKIPFSTADRVDNPVSLYAATKKSNELLAHCYSKLYNIPATGLRFFTVYGAAGRPDMAYFKFTNKLLRGEDIQIFNYGNCQRDFIYIDDIVEGISRVIDRPPTCFDPPYKIYNIGNGQPVNLLEFVDILQQELLRAKVLPANYDFDSHKKLLPMQPGEIPITFADTSDLERDFNFRPPTPLREGLRHFAQWYKIFYRV